MQRRVGRCTEHTTNIAHADAADMITAMNIITIMSMIADADMTTDMNIIITMRDVTVDAADTERRMKMRQS